MRRSRFLMSLGGILLFPFIPKKPTEIEIVEEEPHSMVGSIDGRVMNVYVDGEQIGRTEIKATYYNELHAPMNYKIGDWVASADSPTKPIGRCTGFNHDNTCIMIDNKTWGGKYYFTKHRI